MSLWLVGRARVMSPATARVNATATSVRAGKRDEFAHQLVIATTLIVSIMTEETK